MQVSRVLSAVTLFQRMKERARIWKMMPLVRSLSPPPLLQIWGHDDLDHLEGVLVTPLVRKSIHLESEDRVH